MTTDEGSANTPQTYVPARRRPWPKASRPRAEPLERRLLLAAGALDTSFGNAGRVQTTLGTDATAVAMQPDGKLVAAVLTGSGLSVARFLSTGQIDSAFGSSGIATANVPASNGSRAVLIQPDRH